MNFEFHRGHVYSGTVACDMIVTINPELTGMWKLRYEGDCGDA